MFDMYDMDGSGRLTIDELKTMMRSVASSVASTKNLFIYDACMLSCRSATYAAATALVARSMMDLANDSLDEETEAKMTMVINKMFKQRESGDGISFDQFKGILKEYEGELTAAQLDLNIDGEYHSCSCTALIG